MQLIRKPITRKLTLVSKRVNPSGDIIIIRKKHYTFSPIDRFFRIEVKAEYVGNLFSSYPQVALITSHATPINVRRRSSPDA
jgi:hypothetical protein